MSVIARGTAMEGDAVRAYLRALREAQDISQQAVADALGVQRVTWGNYELGKNKTMTSDALLTVLRYLNGSFRDLQELAAKSDDATLGMRLARRRAEEIARGELAAYRESASEAELTSLLTEIDRAVRESARLVPDLQGILRRLRGVE